MVFMAFMDVSREDRDVISATFTGNLDSSDGLPRCRYRQHEQQSDGFRL